MKAFTRIFIYIWPQWHRLIAVVVSAMVIGVLFSLSFATIVPLLKVMMGEEGLRGWVDRNVCNWRYGMDLDVPGTPDFLESPDSNIAYYVQISLVDEEGPAHEAGLKLNDKIVGAGDALIGADAERVSRTRLLEALATAGSFGRAPNRRRTVASRPARASTASTLSAGTPASRATESMISRSRYRRPN